MVRLPQHHRLLLSTATPTLTKHFLVRPLSLSPSPLICTAMPTLSVISVHSILTVGLRLHRHHITFSYLSTATSTLPLLEYGYAFTVYMAPPRPYIW
jgi:hypothetical protein